MNIEDCVKKQIFGSFERSKLPANFHEYSCELHIEQYQQGKVSEEVRYFRFTPKAGVNGLPFNIMIDTIVKPKNPIFSYQFKQTGEKENVEVAINGLVEYKFQTTSKIKEMSEPDSQGQFNFRDIDQDNLRPKFKLADNPAEQEDQQESKNHELNEGQSNYIKTELITYLKKESNRKTTPGQIKSFLNAKGHRISELGVKIILKDIVEDPEPDKRTGYTLKYNYSKIFEDSSQKNPRKKLKDE